MECYTHALAALEADMIGLFGDKLMTNWNYKAHTFNTEYMNSKSVLPTDTGFKLCNELYLYQ
jgi:hypothetical protein